MNAHVSVGRRDFTGRWTIRHHDLSTLTHRTALLLRCSIAEVRCVAGHECARSGPAIRPLRFTYCFFEAPFGEA